MSAPGLIARGWRYLFGEPKPEEVWKTEVAEFLRRERTVVLNWPEALRYDHYDIYALHQRSLTTGNTRIVEDWRLT